MFEYSAVLIRVIDGDTVVLDVDLGFHVHVHETFRLSGINAFELHNVPKGPAAKMYAEQWFKDNAVFLIRSTKAIHQEKYGRWLASIETTSGACLNAELVAAGLAVPFMV